MPRIRAIALPILAAVALSGLPGARGAQPALHSETKIAERVAEQVQRLMSSGHDDDRVALIVQTWGSPEATTLSRIVELGGAHGDPFASIHGFPAAVPARTVVLLAKEPAVKALSFDWPIDAHVAPANPSALPAAPHTVGARLSSLTGAGVTVAVLDSGISPVADFMSTPPTLVREIDIVEPDRRFADPFGHGTLVAGVIAGSGFASSLPGATRTFRGIAPGTRLISVKVLDHDGVGSVSDLIAGVDWVLRNHEAEGIRVVNLSLGHPVDESYITDPLCQALEMVWRSGIVVVVSAGNSGGHGYATITSPANDPVLIAVGAVEDWRTEETTDDLVASFSSRGPSPIDGIVKPDLVASGTGVVTLRSPGSRLDTLFAQRRLRYSDFTTRTPNEDDDSPYVSLSGTSLAASRVAGAAAILIQQDPEASPDDVKARLMIGARKVNDALVARGAGLLDVNASLALGVVGVFSNDARSPRLLVTKALDGRHIVQVQEIGTAWGDPSTWSSEQVWGPRTIWGLSPQWTETRVWGGAGVTTERSHVTGASVTNLEAEVAVWGSR